MRKKRRRRVSEKICLGGQDTYITQESYQSHYVWKLILIASFTHLLPFSFFHHASAEPFTLPEDIGDTRSEFSISQYSQPFSVDSTAGAPINCMRYEQFINPQQLAAINKVRRLLHKLERVERFYSNRQKMGDAHPQYRIHSFQRKVDTLTLWLKVMDGLCKTLSSMSTWLGVPIILPELCQEYSQLLRYRKKASSLSEQGAKEDRGIVFAVSSSRKGSTQQEYISYRSASLKGKARGPYRDFIDRILKRNSISAVMTSIQKFIRPIQDLAITALSTDKGPEQDESVEESMRKCLLLESNSLRWLSYKRTSSDGYLNWSQEFEIINLPHFGRQYVRLVHIPLDVMHECLKQQLELKLPEKLLSDAGESPVNMTEVSFAVHVHTSLPTSLKSEL